MRYSLKQILGEGRLWACNHIINKIPSHHFRLCFYRKIMKFEISKYASIHLGCSFTSIKSFRLGENSTINQNCHLDNRGGIYIEKNVSISPKCSLITSDHLVNSSIFEGRDRSIYVKKYAFLGYGATILGGVTIQEGSVIGAVSLVTKTTEAYHIYIGTPAYAKGKRNNNLDYAPKYRRLFH